MKAALTAVLVSLPLLGAGLLGRLAGQAAAPPPAPAPRPAHLPQLAGGGPGLSGPLVPGTVAFVVCYAKPSPLPAGYNPGPYVIVTGYAMGTPCAVGGGCTVTMGPYTDLATANAVAAKTTCP